jgi:hypothetical protein
LVEVKFANLKIDNGACIRASPKKGAVASKMGRFKRLQAAVSTWANLGCLPAAVHRKTAANSAEMRMLLHDKTPFFQSSKPGAIGPNL